MKSKTLVAVIVIGISLGGMLNFVPHTGEHQSWWLPAFGPKIVQGEPPEFCPAGNDTQHWTVRGWPVPSSKAYTNSCKSDQYTYIYSLLVLTNIVIVSLVTAGVTAAIIKLNGRKS